MNQFQKIMTPIIEWRKQLLPRIFLCGVVIASTISCSDEEIALTESFLKIYDASDMDVSYNPIDVVEIIDGYIILTGTERSNTDFMGVQLIKVDEEGNYEFDAELDDYVVPIRELHLNPADSNTYFFAMNPTSLQAVLVAVNPQLEIVSETPIGGINYPLASALTSGGNLLLESYDPLSQEIEISEIGLDGSFVNGGRYSIGPGDDVQAEIINHYLNATERPLPFFCGEVSPGNYYFNGFFNYSFSLVFTNLGPNPSGVVQGQAASAGLRATLPLGGSSFAVAGYQFDNNFQLPIADLSISGISSSADLFPGNMAELKPYTHTEIISYTSASTSYSVFVSETKGNQIILNFYNSSTGQIDGVYRVGYLNPFGFSSIMIGADNSLLLLGTTYVAGRFERIMLNKISAGEISGILN